MNVGRSVHRKQDRVDFKAFEPKESSAPEFPAIEKNIITLYNETVRCHYMSMEKRDGKYSIGELAALTGVTRRTIRFYVQKGLLQTPLGLGRGRHYTDEHLERILKIRDLQRDGVRLDRMRQAVKGAAAAPLEDVERRLVTRVRIADGVWLEFSEGENVPPTGKLMKLVENCRKILAIPGTEE